MDYHFNALSTKFTSRIYILWRFIDFVLLGILPNKTPWWLVIPVGLVYAVIYYVVFRFLIVKFNFKTPGREDKQASVANTSASKLPFDVLDAMQKKISSI